MSIALLDNLATRELENLEIITLHNNLRKLLMSLGNIIRNGYAILNPTGLFAISELFKVLGIVWMVVDKGHSAKAVKALDKHTLRVKVGKAERTYNLSHTVSLTKCSNSIEQRT